MVNNNITIGTGRFEKYKTTWANDVGVFETPQGKWIVRTHKGKNNKASTISQHKTKEEALNKYNELINAT